MALGSTKPPVQRIMLSFMEVKLPGREIKHSTNCSVRLIMIPTCFYGVDRGNLYLYFNCKYIITHCSFKGFVSATSLSYNVQGGSNMTGTICV
jgi:hypothetical protein